MKTKLNLLTYIHQTQIWSMEWLWVNQWARKHDDIMTRLSLHFIHKIGVHKIGRGQLSVSISQVHGRKLCWRISNEMNGCYGFWTYEREFAVRARLILCDEQNIVLPSREKMVTFEWGFSISNRTFFYTYRKDIIDQVVLNIYFLILLFTF